MLNNYIWKRHIHCINAVNAKQAADGTFNGGSSELLRVVIGVLGDLPCRIPSQIDLSQSNLNFAILPPARLLSFRGEVHHPHQAARQF